MRIAIIGAGHLGYIIAEFLSNEQYDVVVVDSDESKLDAIRDALDVLTIHADGTSPSFMRDEDMKGTDIVVAVTAIDEVNIIACILAKKNGIPHTIARIRDPKFLAEPPSYIREDFAEGKVRLMETKLGPRSPLLHIPLKDLRLPQSVLIAMIFRDHRMIIPHGNDVLLPLDNVYFLGNPETVAELPQNVGAANYQHRIRRALIIGAGRTGQILAPMLEEQGISVKVIDNDRDHCRLVASRLKKGIVLYGDGTDIDLLKQEGVEDADIVICITSDERLNMMMALLAKHLGARQTIVRVVRTEYVALMQQVGVDIVLATRLLAAGEVLSFVRSGSIERVSLLEGACVQAAEVIVQEGSPLDGRRLMDVDLPKGCLIGTYVRDGKAFIPDGRSALHAGDRAIVIVEADQASDVLSFFKGGD